MIKDLGGANLPEKGFSLYGFLTSFLLSEFWLGFLLHLHNGTKNGGEFWRRGNIQPFYYGGYAGFGIGFDFYIFLIFIFYFYSFLLGRSF